MAQMTLHTRAVLPYKFLIVYMEVDEGSGQVSGTLANSEDPDKMLHQIKTIFMDRNILRFRNFYPVFK